MSWVGASLLLCSAGLRYWLWQKAGGCYMWSLGMSFMPKEAALAMQKEKPNKNLLRDWWIWSLV